ncbi:RsmB/NOP family class I SAM-dependent RNA methyltransferase [Qipengyuania atrilutea]|uniref:RsmB/NOP family class I SAM-dependent RNA methyltransferase n=1 Tax=Qipengyuania atrilutea TaxID=2744473 RepID=A0A850H0B5_9SPHN|nr:RsmB/NOP family class I SAM-dependent RNA methyltransferase [Actirhodobacter atriluteus]NVD43950.1 RsmB/NOP family class I SAM-dependent RNA methyltransferase [Actirhodobacter atriluteus]
MTPAARVQAAIELLDEIIEAARGQGAPADRLIVNYFKQRRYAGSKDRRAVRQLVYDAIRACGPIPPSGRAAMLRLAESDAAIGEAFSGTPHGPVPIEPGETAAKAGIAPQWIAEALAKSGITGTEAEALLGRAPLDIRVNALQTSREEIVLPVPGEPLAAPNALRFEGGTGVLQWDAYARGLFEVQDHGSQLACIAAAVQPGETVIDLCAGAGGKTLALAAAIKNSGTIVAADTVKRRLAQLAPRAERAGASNITEVLLDPGKESEMLSEWAGKADLVLVDAPCSGTGTWRRNPESRWRLTPNRLDKLVAEQARLLDIAAGLVKPGGRLVYVVCSLLDHEGTDQVEAFVERNLAFEARPIDLPRGRAHGHGHRLTPHNDATDGFFIAQLGTV